MTQPDIADQISLRLAVPFAMNVEVYAKALESVLDKHIELRIFDECGHQHQADEPGVVDVECVGLCCEDGYAYSICRECCTRGSGYQDSTCHDDHPSPCWPCATVDGVAEAFGIVRARSSGTRGEGE